MRVRRITTSCLLALTTAGRTWRVEAQCELAETQLVLPDDPGYYHSFGEALSVSGWRVLIGDEGHSNDIGAVYAFERSGPLWPAWLYVGLSLAIYLPLAVFQVRLAIYPELLMALVIVTLIVRARRRLDRDSLAGALARALVTVGLLIGFSAAGLALYQGMPAVAGVPAAAKGQPGDLVDISVEAGCLLPMTGFHIGGGVGLVRGLGYGNSKANGAILGPDPMGLFRDLHGPRVLVLMVKPSEVV